MNKLEIKIPWGPIKVVVLDVSFRKRIAWHGEEEEYAVIQVVNNAQLGEIQGENERKRKRRKFLSLMCFESRVYSNILINQIFSFSGTVSFGYGSTYFCVDRAFDMLGFPVQSDESIVHACPDLEEEIPF